MIKDHWHSTDSKNVIGAGIVNGKLVVKYHKNGVPTGTYAYTTDDLTLCCKMSMAGSVGQFVQQHIRPLPYARID